jgi:hypothetical protein
MGEFEELQAENKRLELEVVELRRLIMKLQERSEAKLDRLHKLLEEAESRIITLEGLVEEVEEND